MGMWSDGPGATMLGGAAPFYRTYACADHRFVAVGSIEPQFYAALTTGLGLSDLPQQMDCSHWPATAQRFAAVFATRSRDEWIAQFDATDACVSPVLTLDEAAAHPHNVARGTFNGGDPTPAPRLSATPAAAPRATRAGADTDAVLSDLGYGTDAIASFRAIGAIG